MASGAGWLALAATAMAAIELCLMAPAGDLASPRVWWIALLLQGVVAMAAFAVGSLATLAARWAARRGAARASAVEPAHWMIAAWGLALGFAHGWPLAHRALEAWLPRSVALVIFAVAIVAPLALSLRGRMRTLAILGTVWTGLACCLAYYLLRAQPLGLEPRSRGLAAGVTLGFLVLVGVLSRRPSWRGALGLALGSLLFVLAVRGLAPTPHGMIESADRARASSVPAEGVRHPTFLIVLDTLRADGLDLRGGDGWTPSLARLAAGADVYTGAVANGSWTLPTHASLFTGARPARHRVDLTSTAGYGPRLDPALEVIHEAFAERGYATSCITANGIVGPSSGLTRGCERYRHPGRAWMLQTAPLRLWYAVSPSGRPAMEEQLIVQLTGLRRQASAREVIDLALADLAASSDPPYFFLNFMDVHKPYPAASGISASDRVSFGLDLLKLLAGWSAPEAFDRRQVEWYRRAYAAQTRALDEELGRFFDALRRLGLFDQSLIVVTADHGEAFYDNPDLPLYFDHHGGYEAAVRVPLIVKRPGVSGRRMFDEPVEQASIRAALLAQASGDRSAVVSSPQGVTSEWNPHPQPGAMSTLPLRRTALYRGRLKLMVEGDWNAVTDPESLGGALYDLERSPFERVEITATEPQAVRALTGELMRLLTTDWNAAAGRAPEDPEPSPELLETLRSLGYVD